ncbi:MAG: hypothetical protein JJ885_04785 [Muricauda sp.]|nr:hypothetical protein [Allomuricauda sp.]MBO6533008.1 hypothetical protein [Allomuricauda sp.]MBO6590218.1 hypothetical protein [Allomuricauda sp.]MBO6619844.1 hypothetical protein [Allomuricauda sp.]MBO6645814.1 hypothetical protein [Allomuricauda sp.]MBO6748182.1 hypothetical protein [Allomuricauda sp.]
MKTITCMMLFFVCPLMLSQEMDEPVWWEMEQNGKYLEMASYLLYKVQSDSTRNKHADYLHISRAYGYLNDYEKAIFYWNRAFDGITEENDKQAWWYYLGTLAFFERDRNELFKYMSLLKEKHSDYYSKNARTLESLYLKFDQGYKKASSWEDN